MYPDLGPALDAAYNIYFNFLITIYFLKFPKILEYVYLKKWWCAQKVIWSSGDHGDAHVKSYVCVKSC